MRAYEFIIEDNRSAGLTPNSGLALPTTYEVPELNNGDAYQQYRLGVALASARAAELGLIDYDGTTKFGEKMIIVAKTPEGEETIKKAVKLVTGSEPRLISTPTSDEPGDTNNKSLMIQYKRPNPSKRK